MRVPRPVRGLVLALALLGTLDAPRSAGGDAPQGAIARERAGRRDLGDRLVLLERAIAERPEEFRARRDEVVTLVSRATSAFFLLQFGAAGDTLAEATALVEGRPWTPLAAAVRRLRVEVPPVLRASEAAVPRGVRLVAVGDPPPLTGEAAVAVTWASDPVPTRAETKPWQAWLSAPLEWGGTMGGEVPEGRREVLVRVRAGGMTDVLRATTCVVSDDAPARLRRASQALSTLGSPRAGTPPGMVPTLRRAVERVGRALEGKVGDTVPDVADELARLEEGVAELAAAAREGRPAGPTVRDRTGSDAHRMTAGGARYRLHVPDLASRPGTFRVPLVVALHGFGGSEDMYFEAYGAGEAVRLARARGWILASPDDTDEALAVVEDVRSLYPVDGDRIYLTGHSMGGGAAWKAAVTHPDLWAAVAPVSGAWMSVAAPTWSALGHLPVLAVTATRDFSRAGAERAAKAAAEAGVPVTLRVLDGLDHLLVVGASLPEVFAFFDAHRRGAGR